MKLHFLTKAVVIIYILDRIINNKGNILDTIFILTILPLFIETIIRGFKSITKEDIKSIFE